MKFAGNTNQECSQNAHVREKLYFMGKHLPRPERVPPVDPAASPSPGSPSVCSLQSKRGFVQAAAETPVSHSHLGTGGGTGGLGCPRAALLTRRLGRRQRAGLRRVASALLSSLVFPGNVSLFFAKHWPRVTPVLNWGLESPTSVIWELVPRWIC